MLTSQVLFPGCGHRVNPCQYARGNVVRVNLNLRRILGRFRRCHEPGAGAVLAARRRRQLGIRHCPVCGSSLWIWLAAILGLDALNMLIGILIGCSIVSIMLIITVAPNRSAPTHEEIPQQSRS